MAKVTTEVNCQTELGTLKPCQLKWKGRVMKGDFMAGIHKSVGQFPSMEEAGSC